MDWTEKFIKVIKEQTLSGDLIWEKLTDLVDPPRYYFKTQITDEKIPYVINVVTTANVDMLHIYFEDARHDFVCLECKDIKQFIYDCNQKSKINEISAVINRMYDRLVNEG